MGFYAAYIFMVWDVFQKALNDSWPGFDCVSVSPWVTLSTLVDIWWVTYFKICRPSELHFGFIVKFLHFISLCSGLNAFNHIFLP